MPKKVPIYLDIDEINAMLKVSKSPRDHLIIHILYKTGLRCHELTSLMIEHIEFDKNQILVLSGKGDKDRYVDIDNNLKLEILSFIGDRREGVIFQSPIRRGGKVGRYVIRQGYRKKNGEIVGKNVKEIYLQPRQLSDYTIAKIIRDRAKDAGIRKAKRVTTHTLRHTFACQCLLAGVNITSLQKLLGHTSLSTTQVYLEAIQDRGHVKRDIEEHPLPDIGG